MAEKPRDAYAPVQISDGRGRCQPITAGVRKLEWLPFRVVSKICNALFGFVSKHVCDRQTDGQRANLFQFWKTSDIVSTKEAANEII